MTATSRAASDSLVEALDVLIIGAGVSGVGAARYLTTEHPAKSFAVVEARGVAGGTWDLFRYPGIRSDSDLYTFGYEFKPWRDKQAIADAPRILDYLNETIDENGLADLIRYRHQVVSAAWSSEDARWLVDVDRSDTGERIQISARWIFCGSGYYDYDDGFSPEFVGRERFAGQIVHPQHWPEDLDYAGKQVVVIGSGATAVTLLPAMADDTAHITMLQRTPTYIIPLPREDALANTLKKVLGDERGYALTRQKNVAQQRLVFELCQRFPKAARRVIRRINESQLPEGFDVDKHFNPPYNPWDQRLCVVPDADLFRSIRKGKASIVTDRIATFTENGILLQSGAELEADIIVTATGLNIKLVGGIALSVDGRPVSFPDTVVYRGMMLSGVPNFALAIGYTNASWTLKIGLLCEYFCKLLGYLDEHGHDSVWPVADPEMPTRPLLDFGAGYVQRALDTLPKQGPEAPWVMSMSYYADRRLLRGDVADESLRFANARDRRGDPLSV
ncbi:SidA/IucD/PvdA family monooxygenase [Gordonia sp. HNM0687]|uniref:SidA/IucD/PvdA family monooxygenase n=1 Tax=Gordonia mangrovi TaxID=2665643 RepID=A0A6L7GPE9_9ACTN|nr:NAD(P)/FAD-dependent oxidoreductase [Gordonia mangrovi]MXP21804.1 SidA/IucD/PvdA family monooxygenase [Gordonia mangrovi]UVF80527.1 NAD(P)/FAD-dependent oxidoreductase [Gordonia mangrovi]